MSYLALNEPTAVVYLLEQRPDGTVGIGNSHECPLSEAILMIQQNQATSVVCPMGVVPPEWESEAAAEKPKKKSREEA